MTQEQYLSGWIKLHRILLDKLIWKRSPAKQKVILVTILLMANYKQNQWEWKGQKYNCQPGEFITSVESIRKLAGYDISRQNVRTALKNFSKKFDFLTSESTSESTKITIHNWKEYQLDKDESEEIQPTDQPTDQPTPNQALTTNKESKEVKEEKEKEGGAEKPKKKSPPSPKVVGGISGFDFSRWPNLNHKAWAEFDEFRQTKSKKDWTDLARVKALNLLMKLSGGNHAIQQKIIDNSIIAGWAGLFALKRDELMEIENQPQKPTVTHDLTDEDIAAANRAAQEDRERHEAEAAAFEQSLAGLTPEERKAKCQENKKRLAQLHRKLKNRSLQASS